MLWDSKKQSTMISNSSFKAEYTALTATSKMTWLVRLLNHFGVDNLTHVKLCCGKQSAIHLDNNPVQHEKTKHIEIDVHFTRDIVLKGLLELSCIPIGDQLADLFTKTFPSSQTSKLLYSLGVYPDASTPSSTLVSPARL